MWSVWKIQTCWDTCSGGCCSTEWAWTAFLSSASLHHCRILLCLVSHSTNSPLSPQPISVLLHSSSSWGGCNTFVQGERKERTWCFQLPAGAGRCHCCVAQRRWAGEGPPGLLDAEHNTTLMLCIIRDHNFSIGHCKQLEMPCMWYAIILESIFHLMWVQ